MKLLGALPSEAVGAKLLKNKVGPWGIEPQTSTVSKLLAGKEPTNRRSVRQHAVCFRARDQLFYDDATSKGSVERGR
jgi:hypothetical protein